MNTMTMNQTVEAMDMNTITANPKNTANRTALRQTLARLLVTPGIVLVAWMIYRIVSDYFRMMELMDSLPGLYFT